MDFILETVAKAGIDAAVREALRRIKGRISRKDEKEIREIVQATMEDIYRFDMKYQAINDGIAVKRKNATLVRDQKGFARRARKPGRTKRSLKSSLRK